MNVLTRSCLIAALASSLAACQAPAPTQSTQAAASLFDCPKAEGVKAGYVGPYRGLEDAIPAADLARDTYCAEVFKASQFPQGFVTVFGSSRIRESNDEPLKKDYDTLYAEVRKFGADWSRRYGRQLPILSGAGPGLMEAANRGAAEAGGVSAGYTTYYDRASAPTPDRPYAGDPAKAFNRYVNTGVIFTSVAVREAAMVRHSAAIVIAPGGTGTEWETYQVLETIKSSQMRRVPVYFFGQRSMWSGLDARLRELVARRVVGADELRFIRFASTSDELVAALAADLALK